MNRMKTLIIYYSHTGNNAVLAERVADSINADTFRLTESRARTVKTIIIDMVFRRKAPLQAIPETVGMYDLVIFMGPIWMFHLCSPLRTCMKRIKPHPGRYGFISLSGGALGPNAPVIGQLKRLLGKSLSLYLDLPIASFCTVPDKATDKDTGSYLLINHQADREKLTQIISTAVQGIRGTATETDRYVGIS